MSEISEYELPLDCFRRLTQNDDSEEFDLIIKFPNESKKEIIFRTTHNKARVISNKINEIFQIDPTITRYEFTIPTFFIKRCQSGEGEKEEKEEETIKKDIEQLFKMTIEKLNISKEEIKRIENIRHLLGENGIGDNMIEFDNINEAISYISTEFHETSIKYLSKHLNDIIDGNQIFHLNEEIINEIIDTYFTQKRQNENEQSDEKEKEEENKNEESEIFAKISEVCDSANVMHFLLQCGSEKCTKEMREYIIEHLSDEVVLKEMSQIIQRFVYLLREKEENKTERKSQRIEYEGDELKGIISRLEAEHGSNLCENGELKITDIGTHTYVSGSLSNLIKYDENHINEYYQNGNGSDPMPNSSNGWIEFDFLKRKINVTSYTLRTSFYGQNSNYHAKSWRIVGSNDRTNWELIDKQVNNSSLNGQYKQHRFECSKNDKYYQYIRFIQDDSWKIQREHHILLTCVEFFGSLQNN